jgi:hypothetical protein
VQSLIFKSLYNPLVMFPILADVLAALESGDGSRFAAVEKQRFDCPSTEKNSGIEADTAIICSDGARVSDTLQDFSTYLSALRAQSAGFAGIWARIRLGCVGWKLRPAGLVYNGPFTGNTSAPVLFVGNTEDPVTPIRKLFPPPHIFPRAYQLTRCSSAHKMSAGYPGSVVLTQNSAGHCSISTPSLCTARFVRRYFEDGELPPNGTVCEADMKPFGHVEVGGEEEVMAALRELGKWEGPRFVV